MVSNYIVVVKFGGKTLSNGLRIRKAAEMIADAYKRGIKPIVVVSAIGSTTDELLSTVKEATDGVVSDEILDDVVSMGERTSARILTSALRSLGLESAYLDPHMEDWPIITNSKFGNADPLTPETYEKLRRVLTPLVEKGIVPIVPGFIGRTLDGRVTTLGRGGSDLTALLIGRALDLKEVIFVSDVDGIMTGDPKIVEDPRVLKEIDAKSLVGLADSDVKFIKRKTLKYKPPNINIKLINFRNGRVDADGTIIKGSFPNPNSNSKFEVEVYRESIAALTVVGKGISSRPEVLAEILKSVREVGIQPVGITTDSESIILYLSESKSVDAARKVHIIVLENPDVLIAVALRRGLALISIKGIGLEETPGIIGKVTEPLGGEGINIHGIFTITSTISIVVAQNDVERVYRLIMDVLSTVNGND
ncbi:aspartate kinase [Candidatus Bathyarchaeota archaeon]|nr:aspartate kinase [Candidatus Bathyarchaeota archaeon]